MPHLKKLSSKFLHSIGYATLTRRWVLGYTSKIINCIYIRISINIKSAYFESTKLIAVLVRKFQKYFMMADARNKFFFKEQNGHINISLR